MSDERDYRVAVTNFGPIVNASITLRPLTVFVGPSNTGKSYLAILLYALHRCFRGPRNAWAHGLAGRWYTASSSRPAASVTESLRAWLLEASTKSAGELPANVTEYVRAELERADGPNRGLQRELRRCYGVEHLDSLVRRQSAKIGAQIEVAIPRSDRAPGGRYAISLGGSRNDLSGSVTGTETLPIDAKFAADLLRDARAHLEAYDRPEDIDPTDLAWPLRSSMDRLFLDLFRPVHHEAYYLPADRTGVMHSHQVVVSTLVQSAATAGLRPSRDIPMLSGVLADFLSELIEMSGPRRPRRRKQVDRGARLERAILDGAVRLERTEAGYPAFAYRPRGWKDDLPLMRASSMVSELAPVVLYLRHVVRSHDVLIIEEPEAHLHPAMQAAFARELARLVRDGVRIVMTTHSEWFLEQIGNLVRLSGLPEKHRQGLEGADCALQPDQVGAWLFRPSRRPAGSVVEEVPLDKETGLFPTDYDAVSEMLYNQGAAIYNRAQAAKEA